MRQNCTPSIPPDRRLGRRGSGKQFLSNNLNKDFKKVCKDVDQASAALVLDLKERGILEDTLVIWGGEFGRSPMGENRKTVDRDYYIEAFTMWMAGAGVKSGYIHGQSDEPGFDHKRRIQPGSAS